MSNNILIGVDGSDSSSRAMDFAATMCRETGASLLVAYIIEWSPFTFNTPEENEARHQRREEELARAQTGVIDPLLAKLKERGVEARGMVRHGKPVVALAQIAEDEKVAQIVVGRRGESHIGGLLFGSLTGGLLQVAPVPVTVVP